MNKTDVVLFLFRYIFLIKGNKSFPFPVLFTTASLIELNF